MSVRRYGASALLVDVAGPDEALALYRALRTSGLAIREVVPAARSVLLDGLDDLDVAEREVAALLTGTATRIDSGPVVEGPVVEVPTIYDGPDLAAVAVLWAMSEDDVVTTHTGLEHVVAFCGFSPGFAYCSGLTPELAVPRRHDPRPRVPAGSVAIADRWTGVYPTASPGGWQLLGRTDLTLWDPDRDQPATLAPGTRVRFVAR